MHGRFQRANLAPEGFIVTSVESCGENFRMRLQDVAEGRSGDTRDMRMMMRPLLEKYIRYRFPNQILEGKWLGDMLAIIRDDTAHPLTPQYSELDDINGYTAPFHHDPNTPYVEDEVRTYAQQTIAIVGGC